VRCVPARDRGLPVRARGRRRAAHAAAAVRAPCHLDTGDRIAERVGDLDHERTRERGADLSALVVAADGRDAVGVLGDGVEREAGRSGRLALRPQRTHLAGLRPRPGAQDDLRGRRAVGPGSRGVGVERGTGRGIREHEDHRGPFHGPAGTVRHLGHERLGQRIAHPPVLPVALEQRDGGRLSGAWEKQVAPATAGRQQECGQREAPGRQGTVLHGIYELLGVHDRSQVKRMKRRPSATAPASPREAQASSEAMKV
jgi:hypothetical protein